MKVGDLIKLLSQYDLELEVWMSSDPEGNTYSRCAEAGQLVERNEEIYNKEDVEEGYVKAEGAKDVVVLWPA